MSVEQVQQASQSLGLRLVRQAPRWGWYIKGAGAVGLAKPVLFGQTNDAAMQRMKAMPDLNSIVFPGKLLSTHLTPFRQEQISRRRTELADCRMLLAHVASKAQLVRLLDEGREETGRPSTQWWVKHWEPSWDADALRLMRVLAWMDRAPAGMVFALNGKNELMAL